MATRLSKNFTLEELCSSKTARNRGIKNIPNQQQVINLCALAHNVLQPLRDWWGKEVRIGSGFRCLALNKAVGGVTNSQHMKGEAADLCIDGDKAKGREWAKWIMDNCDFDELIWEHNANGSYWVHVSYRNDGQNRRKFVPNLLKQ